MLCSSTLESVKLQVINAISLYKSKRRSPSSPVVAPDPAEGSEDRVTEEDMPDWHKAITSENASDAQLVVDSLCRLNEDWSQFSNDKEKFKVMPFLPAIEFHAGRPSR